MWSPALLLHFLPTFTIPTGYKRSLSFKGKFFGVHLFPALSSSPQTWVFLIGEKRIHGVMAR
jgi:hypothetical protein